MEGKPDLIIGNYTDGNLVASLMASKLGVTQVRKNIYLAFFRERERREVKWRDMLNGLTFRGRLHMLWRRQSTRIQMSSGESWTRSTTSRANSLLI
jgi:hypothetical protein